ncbi:hypothetical protein H7X64_04225 [Armatimonadetes bacterium]|nr:hypothetical protein [bacterium]
MSRKIIEVDSDMIDRSLEDLAKLILRLEENPKNTLCFVHPTIAYPLCVDKHL